MPCYTVHVLSNTWEENIPYIGKFSSVKFFFFGLYFLRWAHRWKLNALKINLRAWQSQICVTKRHTELNVLVCYLSRVRKRTIYDGLEDHGRVSCTPAELSSLRHFGVEKFSWYLERDFCKLVFTMVLSIAYFDSSQRITLKHVQISTCLSSASIRSLLPLLLTGMHYLHSEAPDKPILHRNLIAGNSKLAPLFICAF